MLTLNGHFNLSCFCCCEVNIHDSRGFKSKTILQSARRQLVCFFDGLFLYELPGGYKIFQNDESSFIFVDKLKDFDMIRDKFNRLIEIRMREPRIEFFAEPCDIDFWEEGRLIVGK